MHVELKNKAYTCWILACNERKLQNGWNRATIKHETNETTISELQNPKKLVLKNWLSIWYFSFLNVFFSRNFLEVMGTWKWMKSWFPCRMSSTIFHHGKARVKGKILHGGTHRRWSPTLKKLLRTLLKSISFGFPDFEIDFISLHVITGRYEWGGHFFMVGSTCNRTPLLIAKKLLRKQAHQMTTLQMIFSVIWYVKSLG